MNASKLAAIAAAVLLGAVVSSTAQEVVPPQQSEQTAVEPSAPPAPDSAVPAAPEPEVTTPAPTVTAPAASDTSPAPEATTPAASEPSDAAETPNDAILAAPGAPAAGDDAAETVASPESPPTQAPGANPGSQIEGHQLPRDLSAWSMFMEADIVVKAVMIGLVIASVVTWTIWLAKSIELTAAKARVRKAVRKLAGANSIAEAASLIDTKRGAVPAMIRAAIVETRASWDIADKYAIKERVTARLDRIELAAGRDINRGTGVLATIGATAPFVGLFGTVWGIMNSFIGISKAQTTNLAIVAPGIAEALLATALGLVAAIPAVIIYNHFARAIGGYKALIGDAGVMVLGLLSRDFDRGVRPELRAAE